MTENLQNVYDSWDEIGLEGRFSHALSWVWLSGLGYQPIVNCPEKQDGWYKQVRGALTYKFSINDGYALWKDKDKTVPF